MTTDRSISTNYRKNLSHESAGAERSLVFVFRSFTVANMLVLKDFQREKREKFDINIQRYSSESKNKKNTKITLVKTPTSATITTTATTTTNGTTGKEKG